jgi:Ran GTPase-activating protein (RanGAP) involved in mRNA processing and transport
MQQVLEICLPHMQQTGALSTQETFALRPVCRASRQTVDEMRLPVAIFCFPKLDFITAGDEEARQIVRTHKDLPGNFREAGLQNVLRCWPQVQVSGERCAVRELGLLSAHVAGLQKRLLVTHVSLCCAVTYDGEDSGMLAALLQQCGAVTHVDLTSNCMRSLYCPALTHLKGVADVSGLVYVNLQANGIDDHGAASVAARLRGCSLLTHLLLSQNTIGARGAESLARLMQACPRLEHVDVSSNELADAGTATVVRALGGCARLTCLDLGNNFMSEAGAGAVAGALAQWPRLRTLRLGFNEVGDAGAEELARGMCVLKHLESVDMRENGVTADGVMPFAHVIVHCTTMEQLQLEGNDIGQGALMRMCATVCAMYHLAGSNPSRAGLRFSA